MRRSRFARAPRRAVPCLNLPARRSFAREIAARVEGLSGVATTPIGQVNGDPCAEPLLACLAGGEQHLDRPWVLITAGVHGDEIAGVFAALDFLETRAQYLARWFQFAVLPCVNPSGFELGTPESAAGANLNRLFGTRSAHPEVVAVESWLAASDRRFLATFDLHEIDPDYRGEGFVASDNPRACYLYETQADPARPDRPSPDRRPAAVDRGLPMARHLQRLQ